MSSFVCVSMLLSLPPEIIHEICHHLPTRSIALLAQTCKLMANIILNGDYNRKNVTKNSSNAGLIENGFLDVFLERKKKQSGLVDSFWTQWIVAAKVPSQKRKGALLQKSQVFFSFECAPAGKACHAAFNKRLWKYAVTDVLHYPSKTFTQHVFGFAANGWIPNIVTHLLKMYAIVAVKQRSYRALDCICSRVYRACRAYRNMALFKPSLRDLLRIVFDLDDCVAYEVVFNRLRIDLAHDDLQLVKSKDMLNAIVNARASVEYLPLHLIHREDEDDMKQVISMYSHLSRRRRKNTREKMSSLGRDDLVSIMNDFELNCVY